MIGRVLYSDRLQSTCLLMVLSVLPLDTRGRGRTGFPSARSLFHLLECGVACRPDTTLWQARHSAWGSFIAQESCMGTLHLVHWISTLVEKSLGTAPESSRCVSMAQYQTAYLEEAP